LSLISALPILPFLISTVSIVPSLISTDSIVEFLISAEVMSLSVISLLETVPSWMALPSSLHASVTEVPFSIQVIFLNSAPILQEFAAYEYPVSDITQIRIAANCILIFVFMFFYFIDLLFNQD
tara:strand:- start:442 stop:813 length:372 start_codon:yes stop_codon:yes gene_type:complete